MITSVVGGELEWGVVREDCRRGISKQYVESREDWVG